jgi:hypothetical protein
MEWTVRYYHRQINVWNEREVDTNNSLGARSYAARKAATWRAMAVAAQRQFQAVNPAFPLIM